MPLNKIDAERILELLWEFGAAATAGVEKDVGGTAKEKKADSEAFIQAISMLQSYLTNILPTTQPSVCVAVGSDSVEIPLTSQARSQLVKLSCKGQQKLGVELQRLDKPSVASDFHPFFISRVEEDSLAKNSGALKSGDVVLEINGRPLADVTQERAR